MQIRWNKIIYLALILLSYKCIKEENHLSNQGTSRVIENWTELEVLSQKYLAERKFTDSLRCLQLTDSLTYQEKDSLIQYWSKNPDILMQSISKLIDKNAN